MSNVTLPKTEYTQLKRQADAYRRIIVGLFEAVVKDPIEKVVEDFRKTNLYTEPFLDDLESGLRKSSYAKSNKVKAASKRS